MMNTISTATTTMARPKRVAHTAEPPRCPHREESNNPNQMRALKQASRQIEREAMGGCAAVNTIPL
jgi:hypothetical protein